jgi:hypothetical protein
MDELFELMSSDPAGLSHDERVEGIVAAERLTRSRFALAGTLVAGLPQTLGALAEGRLSLGHVQAIADQAAGLNEPAMQELEQDVLTYAETHSVADTRRKVKRMLLRLDPELAAERLRQRVKDREVYDFPADVPGMHRFGALLPSQGSAELMAALEFMAAQPAAGDGRSKKQRMADALMQMGRDVLAGGCSHCGLPARPVGPAVNVCVAESTLLGLDEQAGTLNGDPIPAELARALAADQNGTWRRIVTDALGELKDYGRSTYEPPTALRDHVQARDVGCRFPNCRRKAKACDLDHVIAWLVGGHTNAWNLACLCERHHYLKHADVGWELKLWKDGTCQWTSPSGQVIFTDPETYPIDNTTNKAAWDTPIVVPNDKQDQTPRLPVLVGPSDNDDPPF